MEAKNDILSESAARRNQFSLLHWKAIWFQISIKRKQPKIWFSIYNALHCRLEPLSKWIFNEAVNRCSIVEIHQHQAIDHIPNSVASNFPFYLLWSTFSAGCQIAIFRLQWTAVWCFLHWTALLCWTCRLVQLTIFIKFTNEFENVYSPLAPGSTLFSTQTL